MDSILSGRETAEKACTSGMRVRRVRAVNARDIISLTIFLLATLCTLHGLPLAVRHTYYVLFAGRC